MSFMEHLLGGGQDRDEYQDFVRRYDQGEPWDGISDEEATTRYAQVARGLPPKDYFEAARAAFERMSPQQRQQFVHYLRQRAQQQQVDVPYFDHDDDRLQDPRELAQVTSRLHEQQPGLLEQLLGGVLGGGRDTGSSSGTILDNPLAKAALAGIAAMAAQRFLGINERREQPPYGGQEQERGQGQLF